MNITVTCHAGYRGEERPLSFSMDNREHIIQEILDSWHGPDYRYFKVRDDRSDTYILRHDEYRHTWSLDFFRSRDLEK